MELKIKHMQEIDDAINQFGNPEEMLKKKRATKAQQEKEQAQAALDDFRRTLLQDAEKAKEEAEKAREEAKAQVLEQQRLENEKHEQEMREEEEKLRIERKKRAQAMQAKKKELD